MSQQDQHLTTEQLSTFLDQQLTPEEQASCSAHLADCTRCQHALNNLQQTVNLLRSFPQLEVPRSFALPADFKITFDPSSDDYDKWGDQKEEMLADENERQQVERPTVHRQSSLRKLPTPLRRTLRVVSTLAAVIGLFFALSGFVATLSQFQLASNASTTSASSAAQPQRKEPVNGHTMNQNGDNGATSTATAEPSTTMQNQPSNPNGAGEQPTPPTGTYSTLAWPQGPFLDFNLPGVRLSIGILLIILGGMGFRLFTWQQKHDNGFFRRRRSL